MRTQKLDSTREAAVQQCRPLSMEELSAVSGGFFDAFDHLFEGSLAGDIDSLGGSYLSSNVDGLQSGNACYESTYSASTTETSTSTSSPANYPNTISNAFGAGLGFALLPGGQWGVAAAFGASALGAWFQDSPSTSPDGMISNILAP